MRDIYKIDPELEKHTGYKTIAEWSTFEAGYEGHEKIMMEWIEKWQGETNSALGSLLYVKFQELKDKEFKEVCDKLLNK